MSKVRSSSHEEIPHIQGQRRSPSKMVGRANLPLNQTPFPPETLRGLKQTLCAPGIRDPTDRDRTVIQRLLWRYGSAVVCRREGALGVGMA